MTTTDTGPATTRDVLDAAADGPGDRRSRGETEAARRVPRDLLDGLIAAGVFRLLRPRTRGHRGRSPGALGCTRRSRGPTRRRRGRC